MRSASSAPPISDDSDPAWLRVQVARLPRLSPEALSRGELRVVDAYRALHYDPSVRQAGERTTIAPRDHRMSRLRHALRTAVLLSGAAAALALAAAGVGNPAVAGPGAPLYGLRLAVEHTLLPPAGAPGRLDAELDLADRRLVDATAALARDDRGAAAVALSAFAAQASDAARESTLRPDQSEDVRTWIRTEAASLRRIDDAGGDDVALEQPLRDAFHALRAMRAGLPDPSRGSRMPAPGYLPR